MFFLILGAVVLIALLLQLVPKGLGAAASVLQQRLFTEIPKSETKTFSVMPRALLLTLLAGTPACGLGQPLALWASGFWGLRSTLISLCFSPLLGLLPLGLLFLAFNVSGLWVVALGSLFLAASWVVQRARLLGLALILTGTFWLLLEQGLRWFSQSMAAADTDLTVLMASSDFVGIGVFLGVSLVVTILLRLPWWSWVFSFLGVYSGAVSISVALTCVLGERFGWLLMQFLRVRVWQGDEANIFRQYFGVETAALAIGFLCSIGLRSFFPLPSLGGNLPVALFVLLAALGRGMALLIVAGWGHWTAKKVKPSPKEPPYWTESWLRNGAISPALAIWFDQAFAQALSNFGEHRQGSSQQEWQVLPEALRSRLAKEEQTLVDLRSALRAHLSSSWGDST